MTSQSAAKRILAFGLAAQFAAAALASPSIGRVEAYPLPPKIYAGQDFELCFDIRISQLCDLGVERPSGLPDSLRLGTPRAVGAPSRADDGSFLVRVAMPARSTQPMPPMSAPSRIGIDIVTRRQTLFGSAEQHMKSYQQVFWRDFEILPLPAEGRPEGFSGAVGDFSVTSAVEPATLHVGDIAKWTIRLVGKGGADGVRLEPPPLDPSLFKVYPSAADGPDSPAGAIAVLECDLVPLSTQAVETAQVTFSFFNPFSGKYETAAAPPARLKVLERVAEAAGTTKTISIMPERTEVATNAEDLVQLRLAPSDGALPTRMVSPHGLETIETARGGHWRRVLDPRSGHSGWIKE